MEIELSCKIELSTATKGDQRLKDYSRRRASKQWSALSALSVGLDEDTLQQRFETPAAFGTTQKLNKALSTAEFLLGLPMDGGSELAQPMSMVSIGSAPSSRASSRANSRSPKPGRNMSCSDRLKLSMRSLTEDSSSRSNLMIPQLTHGTPSKRGSLLDDSDSEDEDEEPVPLKRKTFPMPNSTKSKGSLLDDDDDDEEDELMSGSPTTGFSVKTRMRRSKSEAHEYCKRFKMLDINRSPSVRFSLRRQSSAFKANPSEKALKGHKTATDYLHTSLKNLMIDNSAHSAQEEPDAAVSMPPPLARSKSCDPTNFSRSRSGSAIASTKRNSQNLGNKRVSLSCTPNNFKLPNRKRERSMSPLPMNARTGRVLPSPSNSSRSLSSKRSMSPTPRQSQVLPPTSNTARVPRRKRSLSPTPRRSLSSPGYRAKDVSKVTPPAPSKLMDDRCKSLSPALGRSLSLHQRDSSSRSLNASSSSLSSSIRSTSSRNLRALPAAGFYPSSQCPQRGLQMLLRTVTAERRSGSQASLSSTEHEKGTSSLRLSRLNASTSNMLNATNDSLLSESMHKPSRRNLASTSSALERSASSRRVARGRKSSPSPQPHNADFKVTTEAPKERSCGLLALTSLNRSLSGRVARTEKPSKQEMPANCPHPSTLPSNKIPKCKLSFSRSAPNTSSLSSKQCLTISENLQSTLARGEASKAADRIAKGGSAGQGFDFSSGLLGGPSRDKRCAQVMPPPPSRTNRRRSRSPMGRSQSHPCQPSDWWVFKDKQTSLSRPRSKTDLCLEEQPPATRQRRVVGQNSRRNLLDGQGASRRNVMLAIDTATSSERNNPSQLFVTGSRIRRYNSFEG